MKRWVDPLGGPFRDTRSSYKLVGTIKSCGGTCSWPQLYMTAQYYSSWTLVLQTLPKLLLSSLNYKLASLYTKLRWGSHYIQTCSFISSKWGFDSENTKVLCVSSQIVHGPISRAILPDEKQYNYNKHHEAFLILSADTWQGITHWQKLVYISQDRNTDPVVLILWCKWPMLKSKFLASRHMKPQMTSI